MLAFTNKEKEKKAIEAQCVFIKSNITSEILKDDRAKRRKALRKQLFDISI